MPVDKDQPRILAIYGRVRIILSPTCEACVPDGHNQMDIAV
ncbi:Uncharacterised protein [Campylobacter jejuni]|jgi:hypothetical protein|nr:Uncharacterised protein [Campylobacter jejuni]